MKRTAKFLVNGPVSTSPAATLRVIRPRLTISPATRDVDDRDTIFWRNSIDMYLYNVMRDHYV